MPFSIPIALLLFASLLYLLAMGLTIIRRSGADRLAGLLVGYLSVALMITLCMIYLYSRQISFTSANPASIAVRTGFGLLALLLLILFQAGIKIAAWRGWIYLGGAWIVVYAILAWAIPASAITAIVLASGWAVTMAVISILAIWAYRKAANNTHKNLIANWVVGLLIALAGGISFLLGQMLWFLALQCISSLIITYIIMSNRLLTIRQAARQLLYILLFGLPIALLSWGMLLLANPISRYLPGASGQVLLIASFVVLAIILLQILINQVPKALQWILPTTSYEPNRLLREYSLGISNLTSPNLLATVSIGLISEAIEIKRGRLFDVNFEPTPSPGLFRLSDLGGMGQIPEDSSVLSAQSPVAEALRVVRRPIFQHELESSPDFEDMPEDERSWFASLEMELYIPIHTREEWIGMIALGSKTSGASFSAEDQTLISTLADQLSLALQNVHLISSLMRVNNDFRRAYTAMEQSNRQLQQALIELEKIDKTKSDFISVSSHELRTPLTVMRGYTEMLLDDAIIKQNPFQHKMVKGIHSGMMRLHEIVDSMLDVASIDSRSLSLHKSPLSMQYLIRIILKSLQDTLAERKLQLTVENLDTLPEIQADSEALNKVFTQIIMNSIKYTPDGGSITITGLQISPGQLDMAEGGVEITVSDTGIGIEKENLDMIFKKFFQTGSLSLHSTGKTKFKGAGPGLGLAIAKGIVEAHGGKIWAESSGYDDEKHPGSQFHVLLPL